MEEVISQKERFLESEEMEEERRLRKQIGEMEVAEQERLDQEINAIRST